MKHASLKTKMTLFLPVATCIAMAALLFAILNYFETTIKSTISTQQNLMVSILADEIDQKLLSTQQPLIALSRKLTPQQIANPEQALAFLLERTEVTDTFDNGMFLFDRHSRIIAELPLGVSRTGKDFSFRDYLKITFATEKPHISDPYISSQSHHPAAVMMTVPIFDNHGKVTAVLGGSIDLMKPNFLGKIDASHVGTTGYMYMFSKSRKIIFHPDKKRVMSQDFPKDSNKLIEKAMAGFEGTDEVTNSDGLKMLTSLSHLKTKDWVLAASYPVAEAYAPIRRLQLFFAALVPLLLLLFMVMRRFLKKMTDPLLDLTRHVELLATKTGSERLYPKQDLVEVATLGNAFNNLITQLDGERELTAKRETLYRTVVELSSDMVFWTSPDRQTIFYISPACDRVTGYHEEEFYRDPDLLNRILHPDYLQAWQEHITLAGKYEYIEPVELAIITRQGVTVAVNYICRPVYDETGEYRGVRGSFTDITLVKESELARQSSDEALRRQNDYLLALHETTLGLIGRLELHGLLSTIITRAAKLLGTEHGFIYLVDNTEQNMVIQVQLGIFSSFEHHSLKRGEGMAGSIWDSGKPYSVDDYSTWPGRLKDPSRDVVRAMIGVPLTSDGDTIGVIGLAYLDKNSRFDEEMISYLGRFAELASLALDNARLYDAAQRELNERTKAEESLRMLTHAVEQSPVSIMITDRQGRIEYANPHSLRLTGYSIDELLGQSPRMLKTGYTSQSEYSNLWETIQSGSEWRGEFHNRKKNGEHYWELALISPIRDHTGEITHFIAIKEDITDRKKLENELRHSQKMEAIGQLAGGIAHDFNNILTAIIGYASIMQMKTPDTPFKAMADQILATAERGASLTQGLLAFSRKQTSNPVSIDLNEIIKRVEKLLLRLIGEDMHLTTRLSARDLPVMADSMQIEQVLMNLATNARDSMPDGGTITIKTELSMPDARFAASHGFGDQNRYALVSVSDSGTGMDEETVKRIFEPFFTTKETGKGTGLGLSIVYGIVKKHNGYITCHSELGKGTNFRIYLPLMSELDHPLPTEDGRASCSGGKEAILLAEDDPTSRSFSRELLEEFGYSVIEAADACIALEKFRQNHHLISLAILDVIMPGMKSLEVYKEIHAISPEAQVLFCGGYSAETFGALDEESPPLHFIAKPFTPKELLMKIREVLDDAR